MWARHVEMMLGLWLAASVFVFAVPEQALAVWIVDLVGAALVIALAGLCYWKPTRRAHLGILVVALGLMLYAFVQPRPLAAWQQNHLLTGMLLAMFALVPSEASLPPAGWRVQGE